MDPNQHEPDQNFQQPPTAPPQHSGGGRQLNGVRIPMLISGIFNMLAALGWIATCFLSFLAIPLIILGVYEFITFNRLGGSREEQDALQGRSRTLAILAICTIALGNLGSCVCGIIGLVFNNQFDE